MATVRSLVQSGAMSHFTAQLRITATITCGIQVVLSVERQYTAWDGVIPGP